MMDICCLLANLDTALTVIMGIPGESGAMNLCYLFYPAAHSRSSVLSR